MSIQESINLSITNQVAFIEWDLVGEKVNKLSSPMMARFKELLIEVNENSQLKGLVICSKKPGIFIAGADIEEIKKLSTETEFLSALKEAHSIFNMLEDLKIPTLAAIQGVCLGGGLELSLA